MLLLESIASHCTNDNYPGPEVVVEQVMKMVRLAPRALSTRDIKTNMYPFMIAGSKSEDEETTETNKQTSMRDDDKMIGLNLAYALL